MLNSNNISESLSDMIDDGNYTQDYENTELFVDSVIQGNLSESMDEALTDEGFRELFYQELQAEDTESGWDGKLHDYLALDDMGNGDEKSVALKGNCIIANKNFGGGVNVRIKKEQEKYLVTLEAKALVGLSKGVSKTTTGLEAKISPELSLSKSGQVVLEFDSAGEVEKAVSVLSKYAVTTSLAMPTSLATPVATYFLYDKGHQLPVVGDYLFNPSEVRDLNMSLSRIEISDTVTAKVSGEAQGALPFKELKTLLKGGVTAEAIANAKYSMAIEFDENEQAELVTSAAIDAKALIKDKIGVGRYNRIGSSQNSDSFSGQIVIEHHQPYPNFDLQAFQENPLLAIKESLQESHQDKYLKVSMASDQEDLTEDTGVHNEIAFQVKELGDINKTALLQQMSSFDTDTIKKELDRQNLDYESNEWPYQKCGDDYFYEYGSEKAIKVKGQLRIEKYDKDGDDGLCD